MLGVLWDSLGVGECVSYAQGFEPVTFQFTGPMRLTTRLIPIKKDKQDGFAITDSRLLINPYSTSTSFTKQKNIKNVIKACLTSH